MKAFSIIANSYVDFKIDDFKPNGFNKTYSLENGVLLETVFQVKNLFIKSSRIDKILLILIFLGSINSRDLYKAILFLITNN